MCGFEIKKLTKTILVGFISVLININMIQLIFRRSKILGRKIENF